MINVERSLNTAHAYRRISCKRCSWFWCNYPFRRNPIRMKMMTMFITTSTPASWPNEAGLTVCRPVRRSTKFFRFQRNLVCRSRSINKTRQYAVWPNPMSRSRSRKFEMCENCRLQTSKAISSDNMHAITVNYDTPRQYLKFNRTDFWYPSSFDVTWPSNLGCSTFGKRILSFTRSQPAVPHTGLIYCVWRLSWLEICIDCVCDFIIHLFCQCLKA